ncbi:MAG: hypothetical protein DWP92_00390 [Armatimonadetes bacterium]|nr:MAG: hypothetical protein DWP92_00390 [Armatimonadota bacterium]
MPDPIDELLAEIRALSHRISSLGPDDHRTASLVEQREALRIQAQHHMESNRHPVAIATQIAALEHRLSEIESLKIGESWAERRSGPYIQDPSAYSHNINKAIDDEYAAEIASITSQLTRLRQVANEADTAGA